MEWDTDLLYNCFATPEDHQMFSHLVLHFGGKDDKKVVSTDIITMI